MIHNEKRNNESEDEWNKEYEKQIIKEKEAMKKEAVSNLEEKLSSLLSGPDHDEVRKEIAQCTSIELDSKYNFSRLLIK